MEIEIYEKLMSGTNVFVTGAAGVGKSYFVNKFREYCNKKYLNIAVTSSTGISSTHIDGQTIHKFLGFGIQTSKDYVKTYKKSKFWDYMVSRVEETDIIIIDEISMISSFQLDLIDCILKTACESSRPFGGKRMLFIGDFLQMPPVIQNPLIKDYWAFQADSWINGNVEVTLLDKVYRQDDLDFVSVLHKVRKGICDEEVRSLLKQCAISESTDCKVKFVATNSTADKINSAKLAEIEAPLKVFRANTYGRENQVRALTKSMITPEVLSLKVGVRVLVTKNGDNYVNGSMGTVTKFTKYGSPVVLLDTGITEIFEYQNWELKSHAGRVLAEFSQIPLKLGYAITIHKSQGMTVDAAEVDCSGIFCAGQLYVSLSRVKSNKNLFLKNFDRTNVIVDKSALKFYNTLGGEK